MASNISTSGINVNFPIPGIVNNSEGFRSNFSAIKTALNVANSEITSLQTEIAQNYGPTGPTGIQGNVGPTGPTGFQGPTTGTGSLVFSNGPTLESPILHNPIIDGGWFVRETGRAIMYTVTGEAIVSDPVISNLIRIKNATSDGNGHVLIECNGPHGLLTGQTVNTRIDGYNGTTQRAHPGNGDALPITKITDSSFSLSTTTWVANSQFWSGWFWSTDTEIINARPLLQDLITSAYNAGGGVVYLPVGVCVLQKLTPEIGPGLLLRTGVHIVGQGYDSSVLFIYDNMNGHNLQSAGEGDLSISKFTVYGNRQRQGVGGYHGLRFGADNVTTRNVGVDIHINASAGYGIGFGSLNSAFAGFRLNVTIRGSDSDGIDFKNRANDNDDNDVIAHVENFGQYNIGIDSAAYTLPTDPFTTVSGSSLVTVQHPGNLFTANILMTYPNGGTLNGINLTGTFELVSRAGVNAYVIETGQLANASGTGGGTGVLEYNAQFSQGDAGVDLRGSGFNTDVRVYSDLVGRVGLRLRPGNTVGNNAGAIYTNVRSAFVTNTNSSKTNSSAISVGRTWNNFSNLILRNANFGIHSFATVVGNNFVNAQIHSCEVGAYITGVSNALNNVYFDDCTTGLYLFEAPYDDTEYFPDSPFTVTSGSSVVTANAPGHAKSTGALVTVIDAIPEFGIDFNAVDRPITVIDADTFTYSVTSGAATSSGTGGGNNAYYTFGTTSAGTFLQASSIRTRGSAIGIYTGSGVSAPQIIGHMSDGDSVAVLDLATSSYILPSAASYDLAVRQWAAAVFDAGGIVTDAELVRLNTFVLAEKTAGVFDLMDDYFLSGLTANSVAGLISLKLRRVGTTVNNPLFTAYRGFTGNVAAQAAVGTGFIPSAMCTAATPGNMRVFAHILTDAPAASSSVVGAASGSIIRLRPSNGANATAQINASLFSFPDSVTSTIGYFAAQRANTTTMSGQWNNTALTDVTVSSTTTNFPSDILTILAYNNGGTISEYFGGQVFAAGIGAPMSLAQGQAQYANLQALYASAP